MQGQENVDQKLLAAALRRMELLKRRHCFDPHNLDSKPTAIQQQLFDEFGKIPQQWVRAGNQSGKSQSCSRLVTWFLTDTHPTWKKPLEWGEEPLLGIVAGRTGKQIEDSLLPKIRSYLEPGTYKEVRIGNIIQRLELTNGNRIVFQSLENPSVARERLQSYVAHLVWIDELPPTLDIVRELLIRVQARSGFFLASFTPTIVNLDIQRFVDNLEMPDGKVYRFNMLDNPLYSSPEKRAELLRRYHHLPEHVQKAVFDGDWMAADDQVYYVDYHKHVEFPEGYSPMWRHVESVDPALKSALGYTLWAENPATGVWYCISSKYVKDVYNPSDMVATVQKLSKNMNIVRRVSDPHEVWYIQTAAAAPFKLNYVGVYKKNERKGELIKQLQEFLGSRIRISPTCEELLAELQQCRWADRGDGKISNASSYHLLDSAQYFCDNIPKFEALPQVSSWQDALYQANERRKGDEQKAKDRLQKKLQVKNRSRRR